MAKFLFYKNYEKSNRYRRHIFQSAKSESVGGMVSKTSRHRIRRQNLLRFSISGKGKRLDGVFAFKADTQYFDPSAKEFMLNLRVENLDAVLEILRAEGVRVFDQREDGDYGKFGWILDLEGNKIELWEPVE